MAGAWRETAIGRRWFIALAALALLVQVLIPQGYMVSADPAARGLVICTGHGPLLSLDGHGQPAKAPKPHADAPCGFATHGAGAAPPSLVSVAPVAFAPEAALASPLRDMAPGLGLAAPPPPSHAPPARPI
ncbi:MAG: hypothetical protein P4L73_10870 [Caulobacteraceae bacterium]|nr:hypothetical protein [Caulobacteraceae bacterium]